MVKISETFATGDVDDMSVEQLLRLIQDMYTTLAVAINRKPDIVERASDGVTTDTFLSNGDININTSSDKVEMVTNHPAGTPTIVTWTQLAP